MKKSKCQEKPVTRRTRRYLPYNKLYLISTLTILFYTIAINFIITLLKYTRFNTLITIIYKIIKRNLLIPRIKD